MIIISHRGYWQAEDEKNRLAAFERSFSKGFGVETDIRDYGGHLVVSHDISSDSCIRMDAFLQAYCAYNQELFLMLNIKSNGLCQPLQKLIKAYNIKNYFVFDMSVPDTVEYKKYGMNFFTRQSEYEPESVFYRDAQGVWLDEFDSHWINAGVINEHVRNGKRVCIVSPELHKRGYLRDWEEYRRIEKEFSCPDLMICTDYPGQAKEFFNG